MARMDAARRDVLLREYQEAGETSRAHAQLLRTGFTLVSAVQAGVIGFIATRGESTSLALELLAGFGIFLSLVAYFSTVRLTRRYAGYMARAREIEAELGMSLYTASNATVDRGRVWKVLRGMYMWPSVPAASCAVFVALLIQMLLR